MTQNLFIALVQLASILSLTDPADAFWRMPCRARTGTARLDPLVMPGRVADHAHVIHGGGDFGISVKATDLKNSQCTSCAVTQDKSAYWTPSLHFVYPNGTTVIVPQTGGMLVYYLLNGPKWDGTGNITAFPDGFQMLAGSRNLRNFTGPVPDTPWYTWTGNQSTQFALGQKAVGFNCLNYQTTPEPSLYRHFMPPKDYIDANCANGVRAELMLPSCWNGIDLDSPDHKSHVAYPQYIQSGVCPDGFPYKMPGLFFETIWNTWAFKGVDGEFVWSHGDPTGYGYHGDFMMGWDSVDFLQSAVDQCTNLSGLIQDCALFDIQSDYAAADCSFAVPELVAQDDIVGPRQGLPIGVPIQPGPAPATSYSIVSLVTLQTTTPLSATASVPAGTTLPASQSAVPSGPATSPSASVPAQPGPTITLGTTMSSSVTPTGSLPSQTQYSASPPPTSPLSLSTSPANTTTLEIVSTRYMTMPTEVIELIVVRTYTYTTVTVAPMPSATAAVTKRHLFADLVRHHHGKMTA